MKFQKKSTSWLLVKRCTSVLLLVFVLVTETSAQLYSFKNFGLDRGVFPSRIECIAQNSSGELCVGTLAGLIIYNGDEFVNLNEDNGLAENAVSTLYAHEDTLWVGHWAGNVTALNTKTKATEVFLLGQQMKYSSVVSIYKQPNGDLWLVNKTGELFRKNGSAIIQMTVPELRPNEKVLDLIAAHQGLHLLTNLRLIHIQFEEGAISWEQVYGTKREIISAKSLKPNQWLIAHADEVLICDVKNNTQEVAVNVKNGKVTALAQDFEDYIWIGTDNKGVLKYHPLSRDTQRLTRDNGLSYNEVRLLFSDREGQVWIATGAGLDQYLGRAFQLTNVRAGIPNSLVWDFIQEADQTMLATAGGLFRVGLANGKVSNDQKIDIGDQEPFQIRKSNDYTYVVTAEGGLWYGLQGDNSYERIALEEFATSVEMVENQVWVGTRDGIITLRDNDVYERYNSDAGIGGDYINGIYHNELTKETWISALGSPLTRYASGGFQQYDELNGIASKVIQDIDFDSKGNPWIATYDRGVFYLEGDSIRNLNQKAEFTPITTFAISIDSADNVWIGHNAGIDCFEIEKGKLKRYGVEKGFLGVEVNSSALRFGKNGNLLAGTLMGLLKFDPQLVRTNISEPVVEISKAAMGGIVLSPGMDNEVNDSISQNTLNIQFSAVSLTDPTNTIVRYRLIGAHDSWRSQQSQKEIEYMSLPPGDFKFELVACNSDGVCTENPTTISFSIIAPFYRTWWFYTIIFFLFLVFLYLMDRFRLLSILDERNALQVKIADLTDSVMEMEGRLTEYTSEKKSLITTINEIGTQVWKLSDPFPEHWISTIGTRNSNHGFGQMIDKYRLIGIVDVNNHTAASDFIFQHLTSAINEGHFSGLATGSELLKHIVDISERLYEQGGLSQKIKYTLICQDIVSGHFTICTHGAQAYQITPDRVIDYSSKSEDSVRIIPVENTGKIILSSKGLVDQLSHDGTRNFSSKRVVQILDKAKNNSSKEIIWELRNALTEWKVDMDQTDDITIMIWEI